MNTRINELLNKWRKEGAGNVSWDYHNSKQECAAELEAALADAPDLSDIIQGLRDEANTCDRISSGEAERMLKLVDKLQVATAPAEQQWQDISTAPKDGTPLIGWSRFGYEFMAWDVRQDTWINANHEEAVAEKWTAAPTPPKPQDKGIDPMYHDGDAGGFND